MVLGKKQKKGRAARGPSRPGAPGGWRTPEDRVEAENRGTDRTPSIVCCVVTESVSVRTLVKDIGKVKAVGLRWPRDLYYYVLIKESSDKLNV